MNVIWFGLIGLETEKMPPFKDKTGLRYGYLIAIKFVRMDWDGAALWLCRCDCGKETIVKGGSLQSGNTKSCGCLGKEMASKRILALNKKQIGENAPMYISGDFCGKYTKEILELKESIRKRDNYTCQDCRITQEENIIKFNRKLAVHHIDGNDTNNVKENMISLCNKCHRKLHKEENQNVLPMG